MAQSPISLDGYKVGSRVELHPATDLWMKGARFGTVERVTWHRLHVRLDATGRVVLLRPSDLNMAEG